MCVWESVLQSDGCQPGGLGQMQGSDLQGILVALQKADSWEGGPLDGE